MDELLRQAVRSRAGNRCEYCHLPEADVVTPYQVEHVIARQHAGSGSLANLAYSCLRCNLHKGPNLGRDRSDHKEAHGTLQSKASKMDATFSMGRSALDRKEETWMAPNVMPTK